MHQKKTRIEFSVIDTGIGIKEADQDKIFKLFGRVLPDNGHINAGGIGLGLKQCAITSCNSLEVV